MALVSWGRGRWKLSAIVLLAMLHDAFMNSRPHRRNIKHERYTRMGVGLVRSDGRVWVTIVFLG